MPQIAHTARDEVDLLPRFVHAGDVCWDIGANSGTYTIALSRLASRVLAFEPVPHNFEILEKVIRRARLSNVSAAPLALSDVTGEALPQAEKELKAAGIAYSEHALDGLFGIIIKEQPTAPWWV